MGRHAVRKPNQPHCETIWRRRRPETTYKEACSQSPVLQALPLQLQLSEYHEALSQNYPAELFILTQKNLEK